MLLITLLLLLLMLLFKNEKVHHPLNHQKSRNNGFAASLPARPQRRCLALFCCFYCVDMYKGNRGLSSYSATCGGTTTAGSTCPRRALPRIFTRMPAGRRATRHLELQHQQYLQLYPLVQARRAL